MLPDLTEFWDAIKVRLSTAEMRKWTRGGDPARPETLNRDRVYLYHEQPTHPEGMEALQWGRVIIRPVRRAWPVERAPHDLNAVPFQLQTEWHPPAGSTLNPSRPLTAMQQEATARLEGWFPTGFARLAVPLPVQQWGLPDRPEWDEERGVWVNVSEWRAHVAPKA